MRLILSWRLSNTLDADFCVEAWNEAITRFDPLKIFNADQGKFVYILQVDSSA